jgi:glycosyltransferase involved in cell wall biosynthesis
MRIAWTGPVGDVGEGGAAPLGGLLLKSLLDRGVEVDVYAAGTPGDFPAMFRDHPLVTVVEQPVIFEWNRWYSRHRVPAFATATAKRSWAHVRLGLEMVRRHRQRPYDCIFQFSQPELLVMGWVHRLLPPIVVHPCTTAAGELRWHRLERDYALESEGKALHYFARATLTLRAFVQQRDWRKPALIAGPSEIFNRILEQDYGVSPERTRVLRHPLNVDRFSPNGSANGKRPITLLYASRLSTRKGLELIVQLSHRLSDLAGLVWIPVVGGPSMWSDYSRHLRELHPAVASYEGSAAGNDMPRIYRSADALLVPSHYEPGSLVVGEALASGLVVVASDQVGPVEVVSEECCRVFPRGDIDALERTVRALVAELGSSNRCKELAAAARRQAVEHFAPDLIGDDLLSVLTEAAGTPSG